MIVDVDRLPRAAALSTSFHLLGTTGDIEPVQHTIPWRLVERSSVVPPRRHRERRLQADRSVEDHRIEAVERHRTHLDDHVVVPALRIGDIDDPQEIDATVFGELDRTHDLGELAGTPSVVGW